MTQSRPIESLLHDDSGATILEFALLAPLLIAMMMGILSIGLQMHNYNALRSVASDVTRYAVVEYQKENTMSAPQIESVAAALATKPPYRLASSRLDITVTEEASPIAGAKKFAMTLSYDPFNFLAFYKIGALTLTHEQNIYVPA